MSIDAHAVDRAASGPASVAGPLATHGLRSRAWAIVGALSVTETVSWGILYYAFAVFLVPMQRELGFSTAELTGAFSVGLLVSGVAGIAVGRYLDQHSPRGLMTAGSLAGVVLVLAWSQVEGLLALYALWIAIGLVMAAVLYEPAFTVIAKWFPVANERRRALTVLTLVAALASFVFLPLAQMLIDAYGWRDALAVLALILALTTVPLHALVLRRAPADDPTGSLADERRDMRPVDAAAVLRSAPFWMLSLAFVLGTVTSIALLIHAIPYLLERGYSAAFAASAVGLVGIAQIPGRLLFAMLASRLRPALSIASVFLLIALGVTVVVSVDATPAILAGLVILGMGNGMATLARATAIADMYGASAYGTIASVTAASTTAARAGAPVAAAVYAGALGYAGLLWTLAGLAIVAAALAYRAESLRYAATTSLSANSAGRPAAMTSRATASAS